MKRINNHFILFGSIIIFSSISIGLILQKFVGLSLTKTIYYCQSLFSTFSFQIPHYVSLIPTVMLLSILLIVLLKLIFAYRSVTQMRKKLTPITIPSQQLTKLLRELKIFENTLLVKNNVPFAFCIGIRSPKIYISTAMVKLSGQKGIAAILLHERHHLRNKDTLTMLLASVAQSLFPFFPFISDLLLQFKIEKEIQADRDVIKQLGSSQSLISVLGKLLSIKSYNFALAASIAEGDTLEPRIQFLLKNKDYVKRFRLRNIAISLVSLAVFGLLLLTPVQAIQLPMEKGNTTMVCLEGQSCTTWCKEHNSVMPYNHFTSENNSSHMYSPAK